MKKGHDFRIQELARLAIFVCLLTYLITIGFSVVYEYANDILNYQSLGKFNGHGFDFIAFYSSGSLVRDGQIARLYDPQTMRALQLGIFGNHTDTLGYMPFINSPYLAFLFLPLSYLSLVGAQSVWFVVNFVVFLVSCIYLTKSIGNVAARAGVIILLHSLMSFWHGFHQGQITILLLAALFIGVNYLNKGRPFLSGLWLSSLCVKPQYGIVVLLLAIALKSWRFVRGYLVGLTSAVLLALPFTGWRVYVDYARYLASVGFSHFNGAGAVGERIWEGDLRLGYGINSAFIKFFGQSNVAIVNLFTVVFSVILLAFIVAAFLRWRKDGKHGRLLLCLVPAWTLLLSPHVFGQELIFLLVIPLIAFSGKVSARFWLVYIACMQIAYIDYKSLAPILSTLLYIGTVVLLVAAINRELWLKLKTAAQKAAVLL